jgi:hypothetical protein
MFPRETIQRSSYSYFGDTIYLAVCLSAYLLIYLSFWLSIYLSGCISIYLSIYLSMALQPLCLALAAFQFLNPIYNR